MAEQNSTQKAAELAVDDNSTIPRIRLGEQGFIGLTVSNKQIIEQPNRVFQYPYFYKVVNEMVNNPTVAAALNVYRMLICRVDWKVVPPTGATPQQITRAAFIQECMGDMEHTWSSFICELLTYLEYGYSIQEKVFRRRLKKNGSKYNDGLVGIRKLPPRAQTTIKHWYFSEDGRELLGVGQSLSNLQNGYRYLNVANSDGVIQIDRSKILLFSADSTKGNPQGNSILKPIYLAYKRLELLQDQEAVAIAKDMVGVPYIGIPPKYMDPNASVEDKSIFETCKTIVAGLSSGTQRGVVFPLAYDSDTKQKLFDLQLLDHKGQMSFDLDKVIKRYQDDIFSALSVDIIKMGSNSQGSYSLASSKTNLLAMALSHRLKEIANVLNHDLVPQLYELNGWTDTELPKFVPQDIEQTPIEEFGAYVQRVFSVGGMEIDRGVLNRIREVGGFEKLPEDQPVDKDILSTAMSGKTSSAGEGMAVGKSGNGTADIGGSSDNKDTSVANKANAP